MTTGYKDCTPRVQVQERKKAFANRGGVARVRCFVGVAQPLPALRSPRWDCGQMPGCICPLAGRAMAVISQNDKNWTGGKAHNLENRRSRQDWMTALVLLPCEWSVGEVVKKNQVEVRTWNL